MLLHEGGWKVHGFFGEVIKGARARREMTGKQLAEKIDRAEGEVSRWETGVRPVPERALLLIASACEVTLAGLFAEELAERAPWAKPPGKVTPVADAPHGFAEGLGFLGDCLRGARLAAKLTQVDLGARADPPAPQPRIQEWEAGTAGSMAELTFARVAKALDLTPEQTIARELVARGMLVER